MNANAPKVMVCYLSFFLQYIRGNQVFTKEKQTLKVSFSVYFLLFPYRNLFLFFGISLSNLEKIGIDEKVICYHNISNLLWEKDVLCAWKRK